MHRYNTTNVFKPKSLFLSGLALVAGYAIISFPSSVSAMTNNNMNSGNASQKYVADIDPLNKSNVDGKAEFVQKGNTLAVTINATGLEPGVHPQHIHGKELADAECPTGAADVNNDGFISVLEGAPAYGPIKINLTNPQTAFGTPPVAGLFAEFAGTPDNANFPTAGADGKIHFMQTYTFDSSEVAQAAFKSLTPLNAQHVVLHGGTAPLGVDADAFAALGAPRPEGYNPQELSYDALLPVGCGQIEKHSEARSGNTPAQHNNAPVKHNNNNAPVHQNSANKTDRVANELANAKSDLNKGLGMATMTVSSSQSNQSVRTSTVEFTTLSNQLANDFGMMTQNAMNSYHANVMSGMNKDEARNHLVNVLASSKDHHVNKLYEARNQLIDQYNRNGNVSERDHFLNTFDMTVNSYSHSMEKVKNQL